MKESSLKRSTTPFPPGAQVQESHEPDQQNERERLIDDLAFLVVRQHHYIQRMKSENDEQPR